VVARLIAFVLYVPALLAVAALLPRTIQLLAAGRAAGLYGLLYAGVVFLLGRRAVRVLKGQTQRPWLDALLLGIVDALLVFLALNSR
jgi:hypothetical protein